MFLGPPDYPMGYQPADPYVVFSMSSIPSILRHGGILS